MMIKIQYTRYLLYATKFETLNLHAPLSTTIETVCHKKWVSIYLQSLVFSFMMKQDV